MFGGLFEAVKRDLGEFGKVISKDISNATAGITSTDTTSSPPGVKVPLKFPLASAQPRELLSHAITFKCPITPDEITAYDTWSANFDIDAHTTDITSILEGSHPVARETYEQMVPVELSYRDFWARYFFRKERATREAERRALLKQLHAPTDSAGHDDEDFSWDVEHADQTSPSDAGGASGTAAVPAAQRTSGPSAAAPAGASPSAGPAGTAAAAAPSSDTHSAAAAAAVATAEAAARDARAQLAAVTANLTAAAADAATARAAHAAAAAEAAAARSALATEQATSAALRAEVAELRTALASLQQQLAQQEQRAVSAAIAPPAPVLGRAPPSTTAAPPQAAAAYTTTTAVSQNDDVTAPAIVSIAPAPLPPMTICVTPNTAPPPAAPPAAVATAAPAAAETSALPAAAPHAEVSPVVVLNPPDGPSTSTDALEVEVVVPSSAAAAAATAAVGNGAASPAKSAKGGDDDDDDWGTWQ